MEKNEIKNFLNAFSDSIEKENVELYKKIINESEIKIYNNPEEFFYGVLYPFDNFIEGLLKTGISKSNDVVFIYKNYRFIDNHFSKWFEDVEGSACSSDKSSVVLKSLLRFYLTGEEIKFNYDQKYTYHLPKKIFKSHNDIIAFYEGLKGIYHGNGLKYLEALKVIASIVGG